jgi:hypothetical protein
MSSVNTNSKLQMSSVITNSKLQMSSVITNSKLQMSSVITNWLQKPIEKTSICCSSDSIFDNHPIENDIYTHYFWWCQTNFKVWIYPCCTRMQVATWVYGAGMNNEWCEKPYQHEGIR